jgi:hypothetical protein
MVAEMRGVRTMSRLCVPRGACAAAMTLWMTVMKGRRMEKKITMARETCAWRVRSRARGSTSDPHVSPHRSHLASSRLPGSDSHIHSHADLNSALIDG